MMGETRKRDQEGTSLDSSFASNKRVGFQILDTANE